MLVQGKQFRTIWLKEGDDKIVQVIDQRFLPHEFVIEELKSAAEVIVAIKDMQVRGAGLIGVAAAYGMYLAALEAASNDSFDSYMAKIAAELKASRPTAVNLEWAVNRLLLTIDRGQSIEDKVALAKAAAEKIATEDAGFCKSIGVIGVKLIEKLSKQKNGDTVNILTHCNAGWLAFTDYGSATAPIYEAVKMGIKVHVWVDETRPRNQGANLTAWELLNNDVPHTVIADNTGGHLMQNGLVDMVITGADRVTSTGDVANKIGTYLKALAAGDNHIPFYVAIPTSTIDWEISEGQSEIMIEERSAEEVKYVQGMADGQLTKVLITPEESPAANYGFDITPARLVTALITDRGICEASEFGILGLFPEKVEAT
jgi:methylthioribose-1-phosphate isomerase